MAEWDSFPARLRDLLDPAGRKLGLEGAVDAGKVFARWRAIVGDDIADHVEPTSLRDGVLRVRTDSPAWATEVSYLSADIAGRVNSALGRELVRELRVASGPRTPRATSPGASQTKQASRSSGESPKDPSEAFDKARLAWLRRRGKSGPDQGF
jgi:predicted nucleic acid-binding Zn ribbon protein